MIFGRARETEIVRKSSWPDDRCAIYRACAHFHLTSRKFLNGFQSCELRKVDGDYGKQSKTKPNVVRHIISKITHVLVYVTISSMVDTAKLSSDYRNIKKSYIEKKTAQLSWC